MTKILITSKNSPNGIVQKIIGSNIYKNILSFDNEQVRDDFINQEYFNEGENYKSLLDSKTDKPFKLLSDLKATIRIDTDEYPNETRISLLNKDTAVILEDGSYYWYALKNPTYESNRTISYDAELDIFLTNDIKDIEFQGQVELLRAHTDRYDGVNYLRENNYYYEEELEFAKPVKSVERYRLEPQVGAGDNYEFANKITWMVIYSRLEDKEKGAKFQERYVDGVTEYDRLPYKIYLAPVANIYVESEMTSPSVGHRLVNLFDEEKIKDFGFGTYEFFNDNPNTISIHYTKGFPFTTNMFYDIQSTHHRYIDYTARLEFDGSETDSISWFDDGSCIKLENISSFVRNEREIHFERVVLPKPKFTQFQDLKNIDNEVKLQFSQFTNYVFVTNEGTSETIVREFLLDTDEKLADDIEIGYKFGFQAEVLVEFWYIKNETLVDNWFNKIGFIKVGNNELPLQTDVYKEFENNNRTTSKTGYLGGGVKGVVTGAIAGGAAGSSTLTPWGIAAGAIGGGVMGALSGLFGGLNHTANMRDLKKTPNIPQAVSNQYGLNLSFNRPVYISRRTIPELQLQTVYDYLYQSGYYIRKLVNLKDFMKTRYYFNYLKTGDTFNNITSQLSAEIKQIISDTLQQGVRIWHVRDLDHYKGLLNYEFENQEMNTIPTLQKKVKKCQKRK